MVMSPNILEMMSFRLSTPVSTRNYVQIPKESGQRWELDFLVHTAEPNTVPSGLDIRISLHAVNQCFGAGGRSILMQICAVSQKKLQLVGDEQTPYWGSAPGPRWGLLSPRTPVFLYVPY